ncbi:MAG: hypothetical protein JNL05_01590 [Flavobacteriales bacterium]|nr:hypothetical protein [Flavobacteriales bacterium]
MQMVPRIAALAMVATTVLAAQAQSFFGIGYSGTWYTSSFRNLDVGAFSLNELQHPYWTEKLDPGRTGHGLVFDLHLQVDDNWGMFFYWKNHHNVYEAGGTDPLTGFDERMELKVRLNTFGLLGFEGFNDHWRAGFSLDLGSAKLKQRYATFENPDPDWELYHAKSSGLLSDYMVAGNSLFLHYNVGRVRWSFQWFYDWFGIDPFGREDGSATQYYYRFSNMSLGMHLDLGERD